jgi:hypothetical protein
MTGCGGLPSCYDPCHLLTVAVRKAAPVFMSSDSGFTMKHRLLLSVCCLLSACAGTEDDVKDLRGCPQIAVVRDLSYVDDYAAGGAPDAAHLKSSAVMTVRPMPCLYDETGLSADFDMEIDVQHTPLLKAKALRYHSFVSVVSPDGVVLTKQRFSSDLHFRLDAGVEKIQEPITLHIPLPAGAAGRDYQVLVGFQLSKSQLEANRAARAVPVKGGTHP